MSTFIEVVKILSIIASIASFIVIAFLICSDIRKAKGSQRKPLSLREIITRTILYILMVQFVALWRAFNSIAPPFQITIFAGEYMHAAIKTIIQSFPVVLYLVISFCATQKSRK